jgi:hypothetical protein
MIKHTTESLFHRIVTRTARWTYIKNGADSETSVRLFYRKAIFYLDNNHEFTLEMFPLKYSLLKVTTLFKFGFLTCFISFNLLNKFPRSKLRD